MRQQSSRVRLRAGRIIHMSSWLLLFLVPLGAAALVNLFDDNDDDRNANSDGGEDGGHQVPVADNLDGALAGTEGDDTITATRDEVGATAEPNETEGLSWDYSGNDEIWDWDTRSDYPGMNLCPGWPWSTPARAMATSPRACRPMSMPEPGMTRFRSTQPAPPKARSATLPPP